MIYMSCSSTCIVHVDAYNVLWPIADFIIEKILIILIILKIFSANLYEFADVLIKRGVVNAINLDGGGSSTLVQDGILLNYPSDHW